MPRAQESGATRLVFTLWWEPRRLKKLLLSKAVQKTMEVEVGYLPKLKAVLEAGRPAAS